MLGLKEQLVRFEIDAEYSCLQYVYLYLLISTIATNFRPLFKWNERIRLL